MAEFYCKSDDDVDDDDDNNNNIIIINDTVCPRTSVCNLNMYYVITKTEMCSLLQTVP
jgi:hypothetical protein